MPISATLVAPARALTALAAAIAEAKGADPLASVAVAVPTNTCGVMTRRALGRRGGVVGVDMVTLNRLAELIAGPPLAAAGRSPMSTPVIDLTIAAVLADDPGPFGAVASHPSTVVALRELHAELRLAGPANVARLRDESLRGRQAVRISAAITAALASSWYDEADLFEAATRSVQTEVPDGLHSLILHLPQELSGLGIEFVRALGQRIDVRIVSQLTGEPSADADTRRLLDALAANPTVEDLDAPAVPNPIRPVAIVSTTDADEEVREATRLVVEAARSGTPFERIAVLWPAQRPYARLVEYHLSCAGIPWNGRPGTTVAERVAPRLVLDLLDVDRRGLRRRNLFDLLADLPLRDANGEYLPTASWERVSREAGVARDDDWDRRLGSVSNEGWGAAANSLRAFVHDLRAQLGHPSATRAWADWATWCSEQLDARLGRHTIERLPEPEYRAYEALTGALDRLAHLDPISAPVTRHRFRTTLEAELDSTPPRQGRVGHGVTAAPLAGAVGIDVDVAIVLGAAEGLLPPRPTSHPLLSEADRALAGLPTADARSVRLHRVLLTTLATSAVTLTAPRGDLRATSSAELSRWVTAWASDLRTVASHHSGVQSTPFPASATEHRLRGHSQHVFTGRNLAERPAGVDDLVLQRGLRMVEARRNHQLTGYDGDLSGIDVPQLDDVVSPSRLETWSACPHAYFDHYLLDVEPVEEPGDEISITARDRGTAHHTALDMFHQAVVDGALSQPGPKGWTSEHREALESFFDEVCVRTERRGRTGRPASWADERARMLDDLLTWLRYDSELVVQRGAVVLASELKFGADDNVSIALPDGRRLRLKGSIDRVDRTRDGALVVTDHKSGGKDKFKDMSPDDPTAGGTLLQLPSYAAAARARFGQPDTPVHAEYGLLRKGGYARPGYSMTPEVDARVSESLARVVAGIETGFYPNLPERPGWRFYVGCHYCEPDGLGIAERWSEWERKQRDPRLARWFGEIEAPAGGATTAEASP